MKTRNVVTRSVRRVHRTSSPPTTPQPLAQAAAIQVFLFRADTFFGTELFDTREPVLIGRHHRAQLRLDGDTVSRRQCRLVYEDGELLIEDLGSANGTYLNRLRVQGRRVVHPTDAIHVGAYTLKVRALHPSPRRNELAYTEATTRVEAVLSVAGTNSEGQEAALDLALGVHERLYREAVRRQTDAQEAKPLPLGDELSQHDTARETATDRDRAMSEDVPVPLELAATTPPAPRRASKVPLSALEASRLDPEVEARLKDLDELIASLDAKEKGPRERSRVARKVVEAFVPKVPQEDSRATTSAADQHLEGLLASQPLDAHVLARIRGMDTGEFARDLASRLAVDGRVVPAADSSVTEPEQQAPPPRPSTTTTNLKRPLAVVPSEPGEAPARPKPPPLPRRAMTGAAPPPPPPAGEDSQVLEETPTERGEDRPAEAARPRIERPEPPAIRSGGSARIEALLVTPSSLAAGTVPAGDEGESYDDVWTQASLTSEDRRALEAKVAAEAQRSLPRGAAPDGARVVKLPMLEGQAPRRPEPTRSTRAEAPRVMPARPEPSRAAPPPLRPEPSRLAPTPLRPEPTRADHPRPEPSRAIPAPVRPEPSRSVPVAPRAEPSKLAPLPTRPEPSRAQPLPERPLAVRLEVPKAEPPAPRVVSRPEPTRVAVAPPMEARGATRGEPSRPRAEPPVIRPASFMVPRAPMGPEEAATERQDADASYFEAVEISARHQGRLLDVAVLRREGEQYVLGHRTPQGAVAPAQIHAGLRLLRVNPGRTVDLVFPKDVAGHLVRGKETVMFNELTEGRKYSCLRLEARDVATVILGQGGQAISYHVRFLRRPGFVPPQVMAVPRSGTRS